MDEKDLNLDMNMENKSELTIPGKIFFAALASYVTGQNPNGNFLKLKGTPEQLKVIADAIAATKGLQDILKQPGVTIEQVIEKMKAKQEAADKFKNTTGNAWPL